MKSVNLPSLAESMGPTMLVASIAIKIWSLVEKWRNQQDRNQRAKREREQREQHKRRLSTAQDIFFQNLDLDGIRHRLSVCPGGDKQKIGQYNTNDVFASQALTRGKKAEPSDVLNTLTRIDGSMCAMGGANVNPWTRVAMGYQGVIPREFEPNWRDFPLPLRFYGICHQKDAIESPKSAIPLIVGTTTKGLTWGVMELDEQGNRVRKYPTHRRGNSETEFLSIPLLITKLPNVFPDERSSVESGSIVIIDGTHGPATRALSCLLNDVERLEEANKILTGGRIVQLLYDVIDPGPTDVMTNRTTTRFVLLGHYRAGSVDPVRLRDAHQYAIAQGRAQRIILQ